MEPLARDVRAGSCAAAARALAEPYAGTAPTARGWLAVEHPGPWPAKAVKELGLRHLDHAAGRHDLSLLLIRRPGRAAPGRTVLAAAAGVLVTAQADADEVAGWDLAALAAGDAPAGTTPLTDPVLLVCANGRRDECCALAGRSLAEQLAPAYPDRVWECTHLGGHRFAPTALALPSLHCYGGLSPADAVAILGGAVPADRLRGRTSLDPDAQAAEVAVRLAQPGLGPDDVAVDGASVTAAGRTWQVDVAVDRPEPRITSCGGDPKRVTVRTAVARPA